MQMPALLLPPTQLSRSLRVLYHGVLESALILDTHENLPAISASPGLIHEGYPVARLFPMVEFPWRLPSEPLLLQGIHSAYDLTLFHTRLAAFLVHCD